MKPISEMTKFELAAFVQSALEVSGIHVVLSGGTAVSYYSNNRYVSFDLDLVNVYSKGRKQIQAVMEKLGFKEEGRYFTFPATQFFIEFPPGPLTVGVEPVKEVVNFEFSTGILKIISVNDSVKDRLAAFYYWGDEQSLYQAKMLRNLHNIDMKEIERWSIKEGKAKEYQRFVKN